MRVVQEAIRAVLVADATIIAFASTFVGEPAVFSVEADKTPSSATLPFVLVQAPLIDEPFDAKNSLGREVIHDVGVYATEDGDPRPVIDAAEYIRNLFHRQPLTVSGYGTLIASCSGPIPAPTDDQVYGRIVSVRHVLIRA